jgi:CubicO group peptidase (beta-lactamase class C family)
VPDPTNQVHEIFTDLDQKGSPGATCAVVKEGEVIHTASFGEASIEHGVPNRENTVFYIASTSKQFVACSIALLETSGAVSLEDDVRDYVPELKGLDEPILVYHLVHHTSGIRDKYALGVIGGLPEESYSTDEGTLRLLGAQRTLNFPPGSRYMYSNSGYFLLAQIVERVSGEPFEEFTQKRIFGPAGMNDTLFRKDSGMVIPNRASGYQRREEEWRLAEYTWESLGPGGVFTTVGDLAKWDAALSGGILEPSNLHELMLRTPPLSDGKSNNYAFGLTLGKHRGLNTVSHGGGVSGYNAEFLRYPDQRLTVICLANTSAAGAGMRARRVADLFLGEHMEARPAPEEAGDEPTETDNALDTKFAGLYLSEDQTSFVEVRVDGGKLSLKAGSQNIPLRTIASNRAASPMGFEVVFEDDSFSLHSQDSDEEKRRYSRVIPPDERQSELGDIEGFYRSEELSRDIEIRKEGSGWTIARDFEKPQPFQYLGNDLFSWPVKALSTDFQVPVVLVRDDDGKPNALTISMDRALGNVFHRR